MVEKQLKIATDALTKWLTEQGVTPKKLELVGSLKDNEDDDRIYGVFRFKKSAFGKFLIGIAGGFPDEESCECDVVFSGFDEFPAAKNDAIALAFAMIDFVTAKDKFGKVFKKNLDYTLSKTLDADKIARQFVKTETRFFLEVGKVDITSGHVVVADPLCYISMGNFMPTLEQEIPNGTYSAEVSICRHHIMGLRMCTARLKIKDTKAVRYELAKPVPETAANKSGDGEVWTGYPVDAGTMGFIDAKGADAMGEWIDNWHKENPGKNHYDDFFAAIFAESCKNLPAYQREGGDFIEWTNPDNNERMVMIASGFGDGFYQCFWGYDESGEICELVSPLVDPDLYDKQG